MTKKLMGLMVGVALMSGGAIAGGDKHEKDQRTETEWQTTEEGIGGSGSESQSGQLGQSQPLGQQDLTGEVVKSDKSSVFIKSDQGAVVQLKVQRDTQWGEGKLKSAKDLKEGQQVRASFEVKGTENIAKNISLEQGMGGSGFEEGTFEPGQDDTLEPGSLPPEPGSMEPGTPEVQQPGLGGSGSELDTSGSEPGTGGSGTEMEDSEPGLNY